MTNSELFTPFAITHFHDGKHTNADHPDAVEISNVSNTTRFAQLLRELAHSGIDISAVGDAVFIPLATEWRNRLHHQNIYVPRTGGQR
jgi:hypothetical protein